ncbi:MAG: hypothetical protein ACLSU9_10805 [Anaerovoracaceae bacterium]
MKKLLVLFLALVLCFGIVSCGESDSSDISLEQHIEFGYIEMDIPETYILNEDVSNDTMVVYDKTESITTTNRIAITKQEEVGIGGLVTKISLEQLIEGMDGNTSSVASTFNVDTVNGYSMDFNSAVNGEYEGRVFGFNLGNAAYFIAFLSTERDIYDIAAESIETLKSNYVRDSESSSSNDEQQSNAEENSGTEATTNVYPEGTYKIGTDMPAGEYKLTPTVVGYSAYYAILSDSSGIDNIIANDNFDNQSYVTVKDGQYLELSRCKAEKVS